MKNFQLLLPNGGLVNQATVFTINGEKKRGMELTEVELCKVMRGIWRKDTQSTSFQNWADELNESGDYEGKFTAEDALDNLANAFHLNIDQEIVNVHEFYSTHLPLTK